MKILVAGASGLVGSALIPALESEGAEITHLARSSPRANEIEWHPNRGQIDAARLEGFDAIINLAGENIGWNTYPDDVATAEIHQMFMNSPSHRENILGPAWDVIGIGAYKGADGKKMAMAAIRACAP